MADEEDNKEPEEEEEEEKEEESEESEKEEGEGEGEEGEGGEKKKKKKGKGKKLKIVIILVVLLVLLGGVGAGLFFMGLIGGEESVETSGEVRMGEEIVGKDGEIEQSVYYDMEEFIVNLNVGSKRPSFLKMTVSLELGGESQIPRVEQKMPRIRDSFQVYLRELRQEDLQGSAGLYRLREELLLRINKIVYPAKINDILFKEILVQ